MKKYTLVLTILTIAGALYISVPASVYADDGGFRENGLIQRIMEKFGLNKDAVNQVVNQYRSERKAEMQQKQEENLNQAVESGKITQGQKTALQEKMQEWRDSKPDFSNMSQKEKREDMENHREEMQNWAEDQGIDLQQLNLGGPKGPGIGRHGEIDN